MTPKQEPARPGVFQIPFSTPPPIADTAASNENLWHRGWMERTENAYEWWYFDSVSDDGEWSLVVIFLLGSPFSPYSRACELNQNANPLQHNGVFVALHHRGRLLHYQYARYTPDQIAAREVGGGSPMALQFGPNRWDGLPDGRGFDIALNEENANRRRMVARIEFSDVAVGDSPVGKPLSVLSEPGHNWLPVIVGGRAHCRIELHSPAESREPETIVFRGSAYHDHNWGTLPFDSTIRRWLWARADFAPGCAGVLYQTTPASPLQAAQTLLLTRKPGEAVRVLEQDAVQVRVTRNARNGYGVAYPREITARFDDGKLTWRFGKSLESTPFYMRCETEAVWSDHEAPTLSSKLHGRGIGEMLRPRGMGAWLVSHAMRLRIHEPGL